MHINFTVGNTLFGMCTFFEETKTDAVNNLDNKLINYLSDRLSATVIIFAKEIYNVFDLVAVFVCSQSVFTVRFVDRCST